MIRSEETIRIAAPPEAVFAVLADPRTHPEWRPWVVEFRPHSEPVGVGTRITETVRFLGWRYTTLFKVAELRSAAHLRAPEHRGAARDRASLRAHRTERREDRVRFVLDLESPRPLGLPVPGFHALMRRYLRDEGRRLARLVEKRSG